MARSSIKPKKRQKRLQARIDGYERMCATSQTGGKEYTKPGSYNK
jgi:hypothetical protein